MALLLPNWIKWLVHTVKHTPILGIYSLVLVTQCLLCAHIFNGSLGQSNGTSQCVSWTSKTLPPGWRHILKGKRILSPYLRNKLPGLSAEGICCLITGRTKNDLIMSRARHNKRFNSTFRVFKNCLKYLNLLEHNPSIEGLWKDSKSTLPDFQLHSSLYLMKPFQITGCQTFRAGASNMHHGNTFTCPLVLLCLWQWSSFCTTCAILCMMQHLFLLLLLSCMSVSAPSLDYMLLQVCLFQIICLEISTACYGTTI